MKPTSRAEDGAVHNTKDLADFYQDLINDYTDMHADQSPSKSSLERHQDPSSHVKDRRDAHSASQSAVSPSSSSSSSSSYFVNDENLVTEDDTSDSVFSDSSSSSSGGSDKAGAEETSSEQDGLDIMPDESGSTSDPNDEAPPVFIEVVRPGTQIPQLVVRLEDQLYGKPKKSIYRPGCKGLVFKRTESGRRRVPQARQPTRLSVSQTPADLDKADEGDALVSPVEGDHGRSTSPVSPVSPLALDGSAFSAFQSPPEALETSTSSVCSDPSEPRSGISDSNQISRETPTPQDRTINGVVEQAPLAESLDNERDNRQETQAAPEPLKTSKSRPPRPPRPPRPSTPLFGGLSEDEAQDEKEPSLDFLKPTARSSLPGPSSPHTPTHNRSLQLSRSVMAEKGPSYLLKVERAYCNDLAQKFGKQDDHLARNDDPSIRLAMVQEAKKSLQERFDLTQDHLTDTVAELERERDRVKRRNRDITQLQSFVEECEEVLEAIRAKRLRLTDNATQSSELPEGLRRKREELCSFLTAFVNTTANVHEGGQSVLSPTEIHDIVASTLTIHDISKALNDAGVPHEYEKLLQLAIEAGLKHPAATVEDIFDPGAHLVKQIETLNKNIGHIAARKLRADDIPRMQSQVEEYQHENDILRDKVASLEGPLAETRQALKTNSKDLDVSKMTEQKLKVQVDHLSLQVEAYRRQIPSPPVEPQSSSKADENLTSDTAPLNDHVSTAKPRKREARFECMLKIKKDAIQEQMDVWEREREVRFETWNKLTGWVSSETRTKPDERWPIYNNDICKLDKYA